MRCRVLQGWRSMVGVGLMTATFGASSAAQVDTSYTAQGDSSSTIARWDSTGIAVPSVQQCPKGEPPDSPAELKACLLNTSFDTLESAGDEQPLLVVENTPGKRCPGVTDPSLSCRYGPLAKIEPEAHSHLLTEDQLSEGRIIARLFLRPGQTEGYKKFKLIPGATTYWWVQKIPGRPYNDAGRSVYITTLDGRIAATTKYKLQYVRHYGAFKQALASWIWHPKDEKTQGSCSQGCCR